MGARKFKETFCSCPQSEKKKKSDDQRNVEHLQYMLDDQQKVINHLLKRIGELKASSNQP